MLRKVCSRFIEIVEFGIPLHHQGSLLWHADVDPMNFDSPKQSSLAPNECVEVHVGNAQITINPKPPHEEKPKNWKEAGKMMNLAAMEAAVSTVRLSTDVVNALRSLVRGIGDLPTAVGERLRRPVEVRQRPRAKLVVVHPG